MRICLRNCSISFLILFDNKLYPIIEYVIAEMSSNIKIGSISVYNPVIFNIKNSPYTSTKQY